MTHVSITGTGDLQTLDSLVVPADSSAAPAAGLDDAGALSRARELDALGLLQLSLAVGGTLPWTGRFGVVA